jgi:hypothetical protein
VLVEGLSKWVTGVEKQLLKYLSKAPYRINWSTPLRGYSPGAPHSSNLYWGYIKNRGYPGASTLEFWTWGYKPNGGVDQSMLYFFCE